MRRIVTGVAAAALATAAVLFLPPRFFAVALTVVALIAAAEYAALARRIVAAPLLPWALGLAVVLVALADSVRHGAAPRALDLAGDLAEMDLAAATGAAVLGLAVAVGFGSRAEPRDRLTASTLFAFGALWLGLFLVAAVNLHRIEPFLLFWVLAVAALGDVGAYYGGRAFGRRRLAPRISPAKTIAGAMSGLLASVIVGVGLFLLWRGGEALDPGILDAGIPIPGILGAAVVCGASAQIGDLLASLVKRAAGVGDTGRLFPGHGGMIDRLDSLMLAAPTLYLAVQAGAVPAPI